MKKCSLFFVRKHFFIYDNLIFRICIAMPKPAKRKRRKPLIKYQIVPLPPVLGNSGRFRLKIVTLAFSQSTGATETSVSSTTHFVSSN